MLVVFEDAWSCLPRLKSFSISWLRDSSQKWPDAYLAKNPIPSDMIFTHFRYPGFGSDLFIIGVQRIGLYLNGGGMKLHPHYLRTDYTHVDTSLVGINHGYKCDKPNDQPTTWGSFASHMYQTYWGWFSISLTQLVAMKFPRLCHACCVPGSAARAHDSHPEELGTVIMAGKFSNMEVYSYGHLLPRE